MGGPTLNLIGGEELAPWKLDQLDVAQGAETVDVTLQGSYGEIAVTFVVRVDGQGLIATTYTIDEPPPIPPRARREALGQDDGGYGEVGVAYLLTPAVDRLDWERDGLWSVYPDDHIGRPVGTALRTTSGLGQRYAEPPAWPWAHDMRDYCLYGKYDLGGRGSRDFRSMKHNIYHATATAGRAGVGVRAESDGSHAVRLEVLASPDAMVDSSRPEVHAVGTWLRLDDDPLCYNGVELLSNKAGDYVEYAFNGTGIAWIGSKDQLCGKADVYLDGVQQAAGIDLYCGRRVPGASPGAEKMHRETLFSVEGLAEGEHTIKIVVTGAKDEGAQDAFVSVDAFWVARAGEEGAVNMIVNHAWNYPELGWGNYVKDPVHISQGHTDTVFLRFTATDTE